MNLWYLLSSGHWSCTATEGVAPSHAKTPDGQVDGVLFPGGTARSLRIADASEAPHFSAGLEDIGWWAQIREDKAHVSRRSQPEAQVGLVFENASGHIQRRVKIQAGERAPLFLPNLMEMPDPFSSADLVIETSGEVDIFIGTSMRVDRNPLYRLAQGVGVEIGPGPRPQIHSSATTKVTYIEEKPAEEWQSLYKNAENNAAWDKTNYRIGKAHDLPVDDGSLDFIFSSHVVEHLYNPVGHLRHWRRKLKPGGHVLAVVPCSDGTKDFVLPATTLSELIAEQATGVFEPPFEIFERWVRCHDPNAKDPSGTARKHYNSGFSIHVHVYDYLTANQLLRHCVMHEGFKSFRMRYRRNSKDFIFALKA